MREFWRQTAQIRAGPQTGEGPSAGLLRDHNKECIEHIPSHQMQAERLINGPIRVPNGRSQLFPKFYS